MEGVFRGRISDLHFRVSRLSRGVIENRYKLAEPWRFEKSYQERAARSASASDSLFPKKREARLKCA